MKWSAGGRGWNKQVDATFCSAVRVSDCNRLVIEARDCSKAETTCACHREKEENEEMSGADASVSGGVRQLRRTAPSDQKPKCLFTLVDSWPDRVLTFS
jgi:hypothetical protein